MLQDPNVPPSASAGSPDSGRPVAGSVEPTAPSAPSTASLGSSASVQRSPSGVRAALRRWFGRGQAAPGTRHASRSAEPQASATGAAASPGPELTALLAEREIALGGIREGVIAVDSRGQVTRLNETARLLLNLPPETVGASLNQLGLDAGAVQALGARGTDDRDRACIAAGRMLVFNQLTVQPRRGRIETVTTMRDRTELVTLRLPTAPGVRTSGPVRLPSPSNQTDEFIHRVHTVDALTRLGAAAGDYLAAVCAEKRGALSRIMDPRVAALLIARTTTVTTRGASLRLTVDSALPRLDPATSADVVTVLGILLENALDSVEGSPMRQLTVQITSTAAGTDAPLAARLVDVRVRVHDTGPGIAGELIDHVFEVEQVTQAPVRHRADPGFGLAIVQLIATRRGGSVGYEFTDGAAFDAVLPVRPAHTR